MKLVTMISLFLTTVYRSGVDPRVGAAISADGIRLLSWVAASLLSFIAPGAFSVIRY